jgi:hypothetical protein
MTITYSAGVITQANESGQSIVSVSSTTNGITVAVSAHGYSDGDFVQHTGTTSYNGVWTISNTTTDTYDIVAQMAQDGSFELLMFVDTETGTVARGDKDLSGLSGLTGVTHTVFGSGTTLLNLYYFDSTVRLVVTGSMKQTLLTERLRFGASVATPYSQVSSGGSYLIDGRGLGSGESGDYTTAEAISFLKIATSGFAGDQALTVLSGGTFIWYGGSIISGARVEFQSGSKLLVAGGLYDGRMTENTGARLRILTANATIRGITNVNDAPVQFGAAGIDSKGLYLQRSTVLLYSYDNTVIENFRRSTNDTGTGIYVQSGQSNYEVCYAINAELGTDMFSEISVFTAANNGAGLVISQDINFHITDSTGADISGVKIVGTDYNNGLRTDIGAYDFTTDRIYSVTTDNGGLSTIEILLLVVTRFRVSGVSGSTVKDYRTKNGDITDVSDFHLYKYGKLIAVPSIVAKGINGYNLDFTMSSNLLITETDKSTVDSYTSLETGYKWYDRACSDLEDRYDRETVFDVDINGGVIQIGANNWTVDKTAASVYDFSTKTIKADTFNGGITSSSSGKLTLLNGALLTGGTYNCDIDYNTGESTTITDVTCTGTMDFSVSGTYTMIDCSIATITNSSGGNITIRAINSSITTNTGPNISIEYYAQITHIIKDGITPKSGAIVGYFDSSEVDRTYSASFVYGAMTSDGSGAVSGYVLYRIDETTYTDINVIVGLLGYRRYKIPVNLTGMEISSSILLTVDLGYTDSPSIGTTVECSAGTIIQSGNSTTAGIYDYFVSQWFTENNLVYNQIIEYVGASYDILSDKSITFMSGSISGYTLGAAAGSTINASGGTIDIGINVAGNLNVSDSVTISTPLSMQGGQVNINNADTYDFSSNGVIILSFTPQVSGYYTMSGTHGGQVDLRNETVHEITVELSNGTSYTTANNIGGTITVTFPDITLTINASNLPDGTTVGVYNMKTDPPTEIEYAASISGGYTTSIIYGEDFVNGDVIEVRAIKVSGTTATEEYSTQTVGISSANTTFTITTALTDCEVYNELAVDGSSISGFAADYTDTEVDITVASNFYLSEFFAWWKYNLSTAEGMRLFWGGVTAIDIGNFRINDTVINMVLDNTTDTDVWALDNRRLFRLDGTRPIKFPTTGGGGIDVEWREKVLFVNDADINKILNNTKLIPALL